MKDILNALRFNFILVKPYLRYYLLGFVVVFFFKIMGSEIDAVSFMLFMLLSTHLYPFQLEEKNDLYRLYGIAPIKRSVLIFGRYLFIVVISLIDWLLAMMMEYAFSKSTIIISDYLISSLFIFSIFLILTAFEIPGLYKLGVIKGRWIVYVPLVLMFIIVFLADAFQILESAMHWITANFWLVPTVTIIVLSLSISLSVRIFNRKEF
ncbi:MAG TPA: ABC-2 transporter permease [Flexilinea sp.]|nr:ABC-2 transporter permease [Flexilinea sp.]HQF79454.1 ABC-2 transporter permease [Flexilinea sp.]HQG88070.1 ABC-2 transporter permease [Flexilinea sp.]